MSALQQGGLCQFCKEEKKYKQKVSEVQQGGTGGWSILQRKNYKDINRKEKLRAVQQGGTGG